MAAANEERNEQSLSPEEQAWMSSFHTLSRLLEQSYLSVANASFQEGLISFELLDRVATDKLIVTSKEQTMSLLVCLLKKMQRRPETAAGVMATFIEVLQTESTLDSMVSDLRRMLSTETGQDSVVRVFQKNMVPLAGLLEGQVCSIAIACHSRGLITMDQMTAITNPSSAHSKYCMERILTDVQQKIQEDPENLEVFITSVLEPMGNFADDLVHSLRTHAQNGQVN